jgi:hypothetical protein
VSIDRDDLRKQINRLALGDYEAVPAGTSRTLGGTGATGDYLSHLLVVPATTSPGAVTVKDGDDDAVTVFAGGASSVSNLVPFPVILGAASAEGPWVVTAGDNVSVLAFGSFT